MKKVFFKTLNPCECRKLNIQQYKDYLVANNYELVDSLSEADSVLVWSCGFREDYLQNSLNTIDKAKQKEGVEVVITGCMPDIIGMKSGDGGNVVIPWRQENHLDKIFGHSVKLSDIKKDYCMGKIIDNLDEFKAQNPDKDASFSDQFIKLFINEGCALKCSYCSERLMFPPQTSYPLDDLIASCSKTANATGFYDIILQGDNPGSYGMDICISLPMLIEGLLAIDARIKVGVANLNPIYFLQYIDFFNSFMKSGRMLHTRLPIQSASDKVLRSMKRGYEFDDIQKMFDLFIKNNFLEFSTDMIVGFPGEEHGDFMESVDFILKYKPTYVNLSRYMNLETIDSSVYENQVSSEEKLSRLKFAVSAFKGIGIFCNDDAGEHAKNRQERMSKL